MEAIAGLFAGATKKVDERAEAKVSVDGLKNVENVPG